MEIHRDHHWSCVRFARLHGCHWSLSWSSHRLAASPLYRTDGSRESDWWRHLAVEIHRDHHRSCVRFARLHGCHRSPSRSSHRVTASPLHRTDGSRGSDWWRHLVVEIHRDHHRGCVRFACHHGCYRSPSRSSHRVTASPLHRTDGSRGSDWWRHLVVEIHRDHHRGCVRFACHHGCRWSPSWSSNCVATTPIHRTDGSHESDWWRYLVVEIHRDHHRSCAGFARVHGCHWCPSRSSYCVAATPLHRTDGCRESDWWRHLVLLYWSTD